MKCTTSKRVIQQMKRFDVLYKQIYNVECHERIEQGNQEKDRIFVSVCKWKRKDIGYYYVEILYNWYYKQQKDKIVTITSQNLI